MNMDTENVNIHPQRLFEYALRNEIACQKFDSLMEFSCPQNDMKECDIRESEIINILRNANQCIVFDPKKENCSGFEELIEWSQEKDLLILIDNELLLCIVPCDKKHVLSMTF